MQISSRHFSILLGCPLLFLAGEIARCSAQSDHASATSVAVRPPFTQEVWVCNRDNGTVAVVDLATEQTIAEIRVGVWPRSIVFTPDGNTAFVANQRGDVSVSKNFVSPFDGTETRGTVMVIDAGTRTVIATLTDVGTEPHGIAMATSGTWFAVTEFRSAAVGFYRSIPPYDQIARFAYDADMDFPPAGGTVLDVDSNIDMIADHAEPRALTIRSDNSQILVTHCLSGFVTALETNLDAGGLPTNPQLAASIDLNTYAYHPIFGPTPLAEIASQGVPRFLDDIVLSPDGALAVIPHLLHNLNHDVNLDPTGLAGHFANRVYPALSVLDAQALTFAETGDSSFRLEHEHSYPTDPAVHVPYGGQGVRRGTNILTLGGRLAPIIGNTVEYEVTGVSPGETVIFAYSDTSLFLPLGRKGTLLIVPQFLFTTGATTASVVIPADPSLNGVSIYHQGAVLDVGGKFAGLTNGIETVIRSLAPPANTLGYRPANPSKVAFNPAGNRLLLLNRGSEDLFLYSFEGGTIELLSAFPPRRNHRERSALDTSTPMGDVPLGMTLVDDLATTNDDALVFVQNEGTRSLSVLRVDWQTGVITQECAQISTVLQTDAMSLSERIGQELIEDGSRAQTTGGFNNSCSACHFEGGADGNVWQRPVGPRATMPLFAGNLGSGGLTWKTRLVNMGESGGMFIEENGGTGILSDTERMGLIDYHQIIPTPLSPNFDLATGGLTDLAALGSDLYHGKNSTGLNPSLRHAGCTLCHPSESSIDGSSRAFTNDFLPAPYDTVLDLQAIDPNCQVMQDLGSPFGGNFPQVLHARKVNSATNLDVDLDGLPDFDINMDGISDLETYMPMNPDFGDTLFGSFGGPGFGFQRTDPNSYPCYSNPTDPTSPPQFFYRHSIYFTIPTKLGIFSTAPYFHDGVTASLRTLLDPSLQVTDPVYGNPLYPGVGKHRNMPHDIRGDAFLLQRPQVFSVQAYLKTVENGSTIEADVEALLAYIRSL